MSLVATLPERGARVSAWQRRLRASGDWIKQSVRSAPVRAFLLLTGFYLLVVAVLSSMKLLWLDELITLHIARLGSPAAIWAALKVGADPNPPLTHFAVSLFRTLFGEHELALRVPAALGYWVGLASLFFYLKRRLPAEWALCGTVLSMTMAAFDYSYESRSYGIFYGFAMLAFFCWTVAVDEAVWATRRRLAICGMGCALALGICTNYFAVLAFLPIALGEAARAFNRQQSADSLTGQPNAGFVLNAFKSPVWIVMFFAAAPLLVFRGTIARDIAQFAPYAFNRVSAGKIVSSYTEMVEAMLYPLLALFLFAGVLRWLRIFSPSDQRFVGLSQMITRLKNSPPVLPVHERVGVLALIAYPLWGYLIAKVHGGMFSPRFVIPVCLGFAIAGVTVAYRVGHHFPRAGTSLLLFCTAWFCAREAFVGYCYFQQKQSFASVVDHMAEAEAWAPAGSPLVIPDPLLALPMEHYAPPLARRRLVFPVDFAAIRQYRHDDSPEQNLWAGRGTLYTFPIVTFAEFQHAAGTYVIIAGDSNWLLAHLRANHEDATRLPVNNRAEAIGGFTPLCRGIPAYYLSHGDALRNGSIASKAIQSSSEASPTLPNAQR